MTTTGTGSGLSQIGQIGINVRDVARATAFYRDVLGMRFLFEAPGMAFFDCGGIRLLLGRTERPEEHHPASIVYYRVPEIQEAFRNLAGKGVRVEREPHLVARLPDHDLWLAFLRDTEDNVLALMSEVPHR